MMRARARRLTTVVQLHLVVIAMRVAFAISVRCDSRFRRAIASAKVTYLFRAGHASRRLLIDATGVRTYCGSGAHADFEIIFLDLPGALRRMAREPNNLFELVVTNQIEQVGNKYHLFQLGYLCSLCSSTIWSPIACFGRWLGARQVPR